VKALPSLSFQASPGRQPSFKVTMSTVPPNSHLIEAKVQSQKVWRAGTLTYTTAGLVIVFGWLLWGDFAWAMKERTVGPVFQLMLHKFSASDTLTALLMGSLPSTISIILTPIVAYHSDRFRSRWGRRIPFLFLSMPFAVLAMAGVAFSPVLGGYLDHILGPHSPGPNSAILICLGFFWTVFEFATFTSYAVFNGLINDVVPQNLLGRFFAAFRALHLLAGIIFSYWLFAKAETYYVWVFIGMGLLYGVGFTMMCSKVREGEYPPPPPPQSSRPGLRAFLVAAKGYFQECFRHRYYWWFFGASALSGLALSPMNAYSIYFAKSLQMDDQTFGNCLTITYCVSFCLTYPLGALVDRFHPLRACLVVQFLFILVCTWGGIYARDSWTFSIALVSGGVVSGMWYTVAASLGARLLPKANYAQLASAAGIIGSLCGIILSPSVGLLLDYSNHTYRYTYLIGAGLATLAFTANLVLYKKFMALGGPKAYIAPN